MTDSTTPPPAAPAPAPGPAQTLSLISFIVGLASFLFALIPVLGFLGGLAAVILGFMGKKKELAAPKWMWLVGIIAGFVAIAINIIFVIVSIILPLILVASYGTYGY
ncbi:hypothetical protein [uncultured Schumannella sp.]|uniref:hypothetical protein n=1 Tax=uncultured Schumannella sp. TaxID=1195956 RepID=UPI0025F88A65|nr:hypothetical protein [uncultured Schumannella sp.]